MTKQRQNLKRRIKTLTKDIMRSTDETAKLEMASNLNKLTERRLRTKPMWVKQNLEQAKQKQVEQKQAEQIVAMPEHHHGPDCNHDH